MSNETIHAALKAEYPHLLPLLFRLWLSPPRAEALPPAIAASYGSADGNAVRGGIPGQHYDDRRRALTKPPVNHGPGDNE